MNQLELISVPTNVSAPGTAQVIIEKPMTAEPVVAGHSSKNVIIWPGNNPRAGGGNFAYFVRPQPMPTPVNVIRPSIQGITEPPILSIEIDIFLIKNNFYLS